MSKQLADALEKALISEPWGGFRQVYNITEAMLCIADGLQEVARSISNLGNGNASTSMGAIEALSVQMKDGLTDISASVAVGLESIANAVEEGRDE